MKGTKLAVTRAMLLMPLVFYFTLVVIGLSSPRAVGASTLSGPLSRDQDSPVGLLVYRVSSSSVMLDCSRTGRVPAWEYPFRPR